MAYEASDAWHTPAISPSASSARGAGAVRAGVDGDASEDEGSEGVGLAGTASLFTPPPADAPSSGRSEAGAEAPGGDEQGDGLSAGTQWQQHHQQQQQQQMWQGHGGSHAPQGRQSLDSTPDHEHDGLGVDHLTETRSSRQESQQQLGREERVVVAATVSEAEHRGKREEQSEGWGWAHEAPTFTAAHASGSSLVLQAAEILQQASQARAAAAATTATAATPGVAGTTQAGAPPSARFTASGLLGSGGLGLGSPGAGAVRTPSVATSRGGGSGRRTGLTPARRAALGLSDDEEDGDGDKSDHAGNEGDLLGSVAGAQWVGCGVGLVKRTQHGGREGALERCQWLGRQQYQCSKEAGMQAFDSAVGDRVDSTCLWQVGTDGGRAFDVPGIRQQPLLPYNCTACCAVCEKSTCTAACPS